MSLGWKGLGVVAACTVALWFVAQRRHLRATEVNAGAPVTVRASDPRVGQLQSEVRILRSELRKASEVRSESTSRTTPQATQSDELERLEASPPSREAVLSREAQTAETMEGRLAAEAFDSELHLSAHTRAEAFFAAEDLRGSAMTELICGSTLCRLNVAHDSDRARSVFLAEVSGLLPPDAEGFAYIESDDDLQIEVYLSKEGLALPD